jgi:hypothetical protein
MRVAKIGDVAMIVNVQENPLKDRTLKVAFENVENGTEVRVYKSGRKDTAKCYTVHGGVLLATVEAARYTICMGAAKAHFTVYEKDGALFVKRTREDPEKMLDKTVKLCLALMDRIRVLEERIESIEGYETE